MNVQTIIASFLACLGIFGSIFLLFKVKKEWSDKHKRGTNIVFILAIVCGWFMGAVSIYRVILDLK